MLRKSILVVAASAACVLGSMALAVEEDALSTFMKDYHKAPKGVDPVCKRATAGGATAEELAALLAGYQAMAAMEPPAGELASWQEKTGALVVAVQDLQAGKEGAADAYKKALNCKACHNLHKP